MPECKLPVVVCEATKSDTLCFIVGFPQRSSWVFVGTRMSLASDRLAVDGEGISFACPPSQIRTPVYSTTEHLGVDYELFGSLEYKDLHLRLTFLLFLLMTRRQKFGSSWFYFFQTMGTCRPLLGAMPTLVQQLSALLDLQFLFPHDLVKLFAARFFLHFVLSPAVLLWASRSKTPGSEIGWHFQRTQRTDHGKTHFHQRIGTLAFIFYWTHF